MSIPARHGLSTSRTVERETPSLKQDRSLDKVLSAMPRSWKSSDFVCPGCRPRIPHGHVPSQSGDMFVWDFVTYMLPRSGHEAQRALRMVSRTKSMPGSMQLSPLKCTRVILVFPQAHAKLRWRGYTELGSMMHCRNWNLGKNMFCATCPPLKIYPSPQLHCCAASVVNTVVTVACLRQPPEANNQYHGCGAWI